MLIVNAICSSARELPETVIRLKKTLHNRRNYLKLDYRTHVSKSSRVANHCSTFSLGDTQNSAWREKCDHNHG